MTGGPSKSCDYFINSSDRGHRVKGHEKGASWGGEESQPLRRPTTNSYARKLKTMMERCEKMTAGDKFLPKVDRDGKHLGDDDYSTPSPPERDIEHFSKYNEARLSQLSIDGGYDGSQTSLTRAELEQYTRSYEDVRPISHSQQPSYAQSEGYHSYVSSADSTSATPFLDRLRRDNIDTSCIVGISSGGGGRESSASSGSSSETLKWHGSMSDVSSSAGGQSGSHGSHTTSHIAHSARVPMPQRHHSESVLYLDPSSQHHQNINSQKRRLFPVTTYEPTSPRHLIESYTLSSSSSRSQPKLSVAERVCEIERQTTRPLPSQPTTEPSADKQPRMPDHAALKAMQKKALLSFYERHHSAWKSEPQLTTPSVSVSSLSSPVPPQPPPRAAQPMRPSIASRRSSSASDYAGAVKREIPRSHLDLSKTESNGMRESKHQHSSSCGSLTTAALGPMIVGPAISVDDWVPARPPKKPHLRGAPTVYHQRQPPPPRFASPEPPPPPSPPIAAEEEILYNADEPLPPPPPEEFLLHSNPNYRPNSQSNNEKARFEQVLNSSMSLGNAARSDGKSLASLLPKLSVHQDQSTRSHHDPAVSSLDGYYENGSDLKPTQQNGFNEKFNERYVENRIEAMQSNYADKISEHRDKSTPPGYVEMRRYDKKMQPLIPPERHNVCRHPMHLTSPPLPLKGNRAYSAEHQPRSLDSGRSSAVERQNEVNRPGPQTPVAKKYNHNCHQVFSKNVTERQSLRCTGSQKLVINGKMKDDGKMSPPVSVSALRKASGLVRTPSDAGYASHSNNHGLLRNLPLTHQTPVPSESSKPALPPHCPPTSLQLLSQSKASYLSYKREPKEKEKGLPNFQGSYKRTMSPNGARVSDSNTSLSELTKSCSDLEIKSRTGFAPIECNDPLPLQTDEVRNPTPANQQLANSAADTRENLSKTLPRNYSLSIATAKQQKVAPAKTSTAATMTTMAKRTARPPRAQSDPTSSAKVEKKSVAVSASTQDNLDEEGRIDDGAIISRGMVVLVGRSQSDRTGEGRSVNDEVKNKMSDASSQTTPAPSPTPPSTPTQSPSPSPSVNSRRPLLEEIECDRLSRDLASQLSPSHKLHGILVPGPEVKRTTDYVSGLFRMDFTPRSRNSISSLPPNSIPATNDGIESDSSTLSCQTSHPTSDRATRLITSSTPSLDLTTTPAISPSMSSLQQKKHELMLRLSLKLNVLRSESVAVNEEIAVNEALGATVTERIEMLARPQEVAKFRLHVKEVGHITSLLLSLSGRLARAENALLTLSPNHQDRKAYEEKRDKLLCQLNEAKQLKANIDQRSNSVSSMLYNYLTGEEYTDYDHFINMKSKLLVDSREIAEKIQLGEEQLLALKETLDQVR